MSILAFVGYFGPFTAEQQAWLDGFQRPGTCSPAWLSHRPTEDLWPGRRSAGTIMTIGAGTISAVTYTSVKSASDLTQQLLAHATPRPN